MSSQIKFVTTSAALLQAFSDEVVN